MNRLILATISIVICVITQRPLASASSIEIEQSTPDSEMTNTINVVSRKAHHYVFGYGSLICSKSRKITAPTLNKPAHPVVINHLRRTWTARVPHRGKKEGTEDDHMIHGQTAMGIELAEGHNCTGVLIEVDAHELERLDLREKGYDRVEIDLHHIFPHEERVDTGSHHHQAVRMAHQKRELIKSSSFVEKGTKKETETQESSADTSHHDEYSNVKVWVYIPENGGTGADHNYPIMQSYVDIILRGCLSISKEFALNFIDSTHGWWHDQTIHPPEGEIPEYLWVDDRSSPFYSRADEEWSEQMKHMLDDLLKEIHPEPFQKRRHLKTLDNS